MHPQNIHNAPHHFSDLADRWPPLKAYLTKGTLQKPKPDFSDPQAVLCFNQALLALDYHIHGWSLPPGHLCPPVPGRADYLHALADLLANHPVSAPSPASPIRVLDVGTGASGIYPLLGARLFGWQFVASDILSTSLHLAQQNLLQNPDLARLIELRHQQDKTSFFTGIVQHHEYFDLTLCNPPFYASDEVSDNANRKKWPSGASPFAGKDNELWCDGGERAFIQNMMRESQSFAHQVGWFTCLVSKGGNLRALQDILKRLNVTESHVVEMQQGRKISRLIAWRFE